MSIPGWGFLEETVNEIDEAAGLVYEVHVKRNDQAIWEVRVGFQYQTVECDAQGNNVNLSVACKECANDVQNIMRRVR